MPDLDPKDFYDYHKVRRLIFDQLQAAFPGRFERLSDNTIVSVDDRLIEIKPDRKDFGRWDRVEVDFRLSYTEKKFVSVLNTWTTNISQGTFDTKKVMERVKIGVKARKEALELEEKHAQSRKHQETARNGVRDQLVAQLKSQGFLGRHAYGDVVDFALPNGINGRLVIDSDGVTVQEVELSQGRVTPERIGKILAALAEAPLPQDVEPTDNA